MIIVEGADNCGKTTLVNELIELDPRLQLIKRKRFKPGKSETIASSYINALIPLNGDRVSHGDGIIDRMLASEIIYGDLLRGGSRITPAEHMAIIGLLVSYRATIVWCDIPDEELLRTWSDRSQMYDDPVRIAEAYRERFPRIFRRMPYMVRYDWTASDASSIRRRIVRDHRKRQREIRRDLSWWSNVPYGVGLLSNPSVIIIGDSLSPSAKYPIPFSNGPAGTFLAESLSMIEAWDPADVYITNAHKGTDHDLTILREEMCYLADRYTQVLLLGNEAEDAFEAIRESLDDPPTTTKLPHPMYWKRFHFSDRDEYSRMLKRALNWSL